MDAGWNACTADCANEEDVSAVTVCHTMTIHPHRAHAETHGIAVFLHADAVPYPLDNLGSRHSRESLSQRCPPGSEHLIAHPRRSHILKPQGVCLQTPTGEMISQHLGRHITQILVTECSQEFSACLLIGLRLQEISQHMMVGTRLYHQSIRAVLGKCLSHVSVAYAVLLGQAPLVGLLLCIGYLGFVFTLGRRDKIEIQFTGIGRILVQHHLYGILLAYTGLAESEFPLMCCPHDQITTATCEVSASILTTGESGYGIQLSVIIQPEGDRGMLHGVSLSISHSGHQG